MKQLKKELTNFIKDLSDLTAMEFFSLFMLAPSVLLLMVITLKKAVL